MDEDTKAIWKLAASGDAEALSCLRDEMYLAANQVDEIAVSEEFLAHTEMLARLAHFAGAETGTVELVGILIIRAARFSANADYFDEGAEEARTQGDEDKARVVSSWAQSARYRAEKYYTEARDLYPVVINGDSDDAAVMLAKGLTHAADGGDEDTAVLLQSLMDGTTRERALTIINAIRQTESVQ